MPIKPENLKRYPRDWKAIRAGDRVVSWHTPWLEWPLSHPCGGYECPTQLAEKWQPNQPGKDAELAEALPALLTVERWRWETTHYGARQIYRRHTFLYSVDVGRYEPCFRCGNGPAKGLLGCTDRSRIVEWSQGRCADHDMPSHEEWPRDVPAELIEQPGVAPWFEWRKRLLAENAREVESAREDEMYRWG